MSENLYLSHSSRASVVPWRHCPFRMRKEKGGRKKEQERRLTCGEKGEDGWSGVEKVFKESEEAKRKKAKPPNGRTSGKRTEYGMNPACQNGRRITDFETRD